MSEGLNVRDLSIACQRGDAQDVLVHPISFSIKPGECMALVGESGSGKSLTAKAIIQLLPMNIMVSESASITLDQLDILAQTERSMCGVRGSSMGLISQDALSVFNPVRSIGAQMLEACPRSIRKMPRHDRLAYLCELLLKVGLDNPKPILSQYAHQLSGGMRQRALIAMAMASQPKLLIADEPTTALDVVHQKKIVNLLQGLCREQRCALLLITHHIRMAAYCSDTMAVMQQGRLVDQGQSHAVIKTPQSDYTRALMKAVVSSTDQDRMVRYHRLILSVQELSVRYGRRALGIGAAPTLALQNVSFDLHRGETLALVGSSGSGKTTLAKVIMGMVQPSHGHWSLAEGLTAASIQMIFQDPSAAVDPRWLVRDILLEAYQRCVKRQSYSREQDCALAEVLNQVGLNTRILLRYPHACSGGELQRVCIARALLMEPEIIICDEPTSALDASIQQQIILLLQRIQQQYGLALLYITHDLDVLKGFADRVLIMDEGRVVESGDLDSITRHSKSLAAQKLLEASWPEIDVTY